MTDMRRITVSFPEDIEQAIMELRKTDKYSRCSYSELVRMLVRAGLDNDKTNRERG